MKISPPTQPEDLDAKIEEIQKAKSDYEKKNTEDQKKEEELDEQEIRKKVEAEFEQRRNGDRGGPRQRRERDEDKDVFGDSGDEEDRRKDRRAPR